MKSRMRTLIASALLALPLVAQAPAIGTDEAFFKQDPKVVMRLCTLEARRLAKRDPHVPAETGDVLLTLGERAQAEAIFEELTRPGKRSDGETHRLIGRAWLRHGFKTEALKAYDPLVKRLEYLGWDARKNIDKRIAIDLIQAGLLQEALPFVESSYNADRRDAQNCFELGAAALAAGYTDGAVLCFQRAFLANPKDAEAWLVAANALGDQLLRPTPKP